MNIAENIKKYRKAKGLTQLEFSKLTGISNTMICLHEKGSFYPSLTTVCKYAEVLGVSLDYLVYGGEE